MAARQSTTQETSRGCPSDVLNDRLCGILGMEEDGYPLSARPGQTRR